MRSLGNLRIEAHLVNKKVTCTIQVDSRAIARFVERNLYELYQKLSALDYTVEGLSCVVKKPDSEQGTPLGGFSLLEMRLVDIVV